MDELPRFDYAKAWFLCAAASTAASSACRHHCCCAPPPPLPHATAPPTPASLPPTHVPASPRKDRRYVAQMSSQTVQILSSDEMLPPRP